MDPDTTGRPRTPEEVCADLAEQVSRLADRLRSLSEVRLARALPPAGSRADAGHALAQRLADAAAALDGEPARPVPRLHDLAVGDQVAVTGTDLVAAVCLAAGRGPAGHGPGVDADGWASTAGAAIEAVRALRAAL